jgi:hypothetical protein
MRRVLSARRFLPIVAILLIGAFQFDAAELHVTRRMRLKARHMEANLERYKDAKQNDISCDESRDTSVDGNANRAAAIAGRQPGSTVGSASSARELPPRRPSPWSLFRIRDSSSRAINDRASVSSEVDTHERFNPSPCAASGTTTQRLKAH